MTDSLPTLTLHQKYAQAVTLYTSTERSLKDIAGECGVSATALGAYLRRYRRELVLRRNGMEEDGCIKAAGRQTAPAHAKYKEAVAAVRHDGIHRPERLAGGAEVPRGRHGTCQFHENPLSGHSRQA